MNLRAYGREVIMGKRKYENQLLPNDIFGMGTSLNYEVFDKIVIFREE